MRLTDLHGNTLKVYLRLVESCDEQDRCTLSQRRLSRQVGLSRQATDRAFARLQQQRWIVRHGSEWGVDATPARAFFQRLAARSGEIDPGEEARENLPAAGMDAASGLKSRPDEPESGLETRPDEPESGLETRPAEPESGLETRPVGMESGLKNRPLRPHSDDPPTRVRTSRSSSNEEDGSCTAVPPSSSSSSLLPSREGRGKEGGVGGENAPGEETARKTPPGVGGETPGEGKPRKIPPSIYLSRMQSWWDAIWPDNLEEEIPWFGQLWEAFGEEIPVQALRQFAESGRTLADLDYPDRFPNYFRTCCRNAQQGSPPPPEKPASPATQRPSPPEGNGRRTAAAEPSPDPAVHASREPVWVDVRADKERRKAVARRKLMATFLADPADPLHPPSPHAFPAPFRRERRRP